MLAYLQMAPLPTCTKKSLPMHQVFRPWICESLDCSAQTTSFSLKRWWRAFIRKLISRQLYQSLGVISAALGSSLVNSETSSLKSPVTSRQWTIRVWKNCPHRIKCWVKEDLRLATGLNETEIASVRAVLEEYRTKIQPLVAWHLKWA